MAIFALPLMLIFIPALVVTLLLCVVIIVVMLLFSCPCYACGGGKKGGGKAYEKKFYGTLTHQGSFLIVGLLSYWCAVFGPFYQRPGDWVPLLTGSWKYVAPCSSAHEILSSQPSNLSGSLVKVRTMAPMLSACMPV